MMDRKLSHQVKPQANHLLGGWWIHISVLNVNLPWPFLFMSSLYFLHAVVSFCWFQAIGGGNGSKNGLRYRTCVRRAIDRFFCIRIWPQIKVIQWARAENHSIEESCWCVLSSFWWCNPLCTRRCSLKATIVESSKIRAAYSVFLNLK